MRRILLIVAVTMAAWGLGPTFRPDYLFKGTALSGWHPLGSATWKAANGEIVGTAGTPEGGWLVLDRPFQDVAFYADVLCAGECRSGLLLRAEKTPAGMKGIFVSFTEGDVNGYSVTLDGDGKVTSREKLPPAKPAAITSSGNNVGGRGGATTAPGAPGAGRGGRAPGLPAGVHMPNMIRPNGAYQSGEWNGMEVLLAGAVVIPRINGGTPPGSAGAAEESSGKFGPIAIYVGGKGEVRLKNVAYTDLLVRPLPPSNSLRISRCAA
jgi:hypothetical protein